MSNLERLLYVKITMYVIVIVIVIVHVKITILLYRTTYDRSRFSLVTQRGLVEDNVDDLEPDVVLRGEGLGGGLCLDGEDLTVNTWLTWSALVSFFPVNALS